MEGSGHGTFNISSDGIFRKGYKIKAKINEIISYYRKKLIINNIIKLCFFIPLYFVLIYFSIYFLYILPIILLSILMISSYEKNIVTSIKDLSGTHRRFYYLYSIYKEKGKSPLLEYELTKIGETLLNFEYRIRIRDNLIRLLYMQIILIILWVWLGPRSITDFPELFFVKNKIIYYDQFTKEKPSIYIKTYGKAVKLQILNNKKRLGIYRVLNEKIEFKSLESGSLVVKNKNIIQTLTVKVLKPVKINIQLSKKKYFIGEKIDYSVSVIGKYDTYTVTLMNEYEKKEIFLTGSFKLTTDTFISGNFYLYGKLVGHFEKNISGITNYAPIARITFPGKDDIIETFLGKYRIKYSLKDSDGLKQVFLNIEKENGKKIIFKIKNLYGKRNFSSVFDMPLEKVASVRDNLIYYYISATDKYGLMGESKHYVLSLADQQNIEEMFESLQSQIFGDIEDVQKEFNSENLESMSRKIDEEKKVKEIQESVEKIKKAADYIEAKSEQLKLEKDIIDKLKKQMALMKEILNERVLDALKEKLNKSMNKNGSKDKLTNEDLKKLSFELEKMVKALMEYKKGLDAQNIAEKLDKLKKETKNVNKKLDSIKSDANELFSKFNENDKKILDPDKTMYDMEQLKKMSNKDKFQNKKKQVSQSLKHYAKSKMNQQSGQNVDLMPLIKTVFNVDEISTFAGANWENEMKNGMTSIEEQLKTIGSMILMIDYSLDKKLKDAKKQFEMFSLNKDMGHFYLFKKDYSIFANEFLEVVSNLQSSSCPNPGGQGEDLLQKLNDLASDQGKLNSYLDKLMEKMKESGLQKKLNQALENAGKEQSRIDKELSKLKNEIEKGKKEGKLTGDPNEISKEMKDIAKKLKKGELNKDITKKSKRVYVQLLQMQQAIYERKDESARYSKMGKFLQKWYPQINNKKKKRINSVYSDILREMTK
ncbi:hypothetical protein J7L48_11595 [bacterium]|nr:hypothetical protein [bacterium]